MRILVVNWLDRLNPRGGGAEVHLHEVFGRMAAWGHDVTLVCSGWKGLPARAELDGLDVHRVGRRNTFALHGRAYVRRELPGPWDILVEDLNKAPLFTPRWRVAPVALVVHHLFGGTAFREAPLPLALATWLLERRIPRVYADVDTVAVSRSTAADLVRRGMRPDRVRVIPNGIDHTRFAPESEPARFAEPSLLFLGRLRRYKRVDLVLRALAVLGRQGVAAHLRVAGRGHDERRLRSLARRLGIADRVEWLGFVSEERKLDLLRRSWVHVLTSPKEGWGITNLEAAACGTPTVASDSPGLRDSVIDGETGFLVPHGDVAALSVRLGQLLADEELRARLGQGALRFASGFSWQASARAMERFLSERVAPSGVDP